MAATKFSDLILSTDVNIQILKWMKYNKNKGNVLHIIGGTGSGKTALVQATASLLKYNLIEVTSADIKEMSKIRKSVDTYSKDGSGNLNNSSNILLIDESFIDNLSVFIRDISKSIIPIIITSTGLFIKINKFNHSGNIISTIANTNINITTVKIESPTTDIVSRIVKSNFPDVPLDSRFIARLCEHNSYDIRSIIRYYKLYYINRRNIPYGGIYDITKLSSYLNNISMFSENIFQQCTRVLRKRMSFCDLSDIYSNRLARYCQNSIMACNNVGNRNSSISSNNENSHNNNRGNFVNDGGHSINTFNSTSSINFISEMLRNSSDVAILPDRYKFLELVKMNQLRGEFIYQKDEIIGNKTIEDDNNNVGSINNNISNNKLYAYLFVNMYNRATNNRSGLLHIKKTLEYYHKELIDNINAKQNSDKNNNGGIFSDIFNIYNDVDTMLKKAVKEDLEKVFRYKYNTGSSNSVIRDVSIEEIL